MNDKTILITGGSSGIGFATAIALAAKSAEIVLVARNEAKLKEAVRKIQQATGNNKVRYYVADISSQTAIRALAEQIKNEYKKIDVLINNAGCVSGKFNLTEDGFETTIATNYFAYFLLTRLLLDLVKQSDYARIINVSSALHEDAIIDFESFKHQKKTTFSAKIRDIFKARFSLKLLLIFMGYFLIRYYAQSKLADILFTFELAERLKGTHVTVNCLHPGFVKTDIGNKGTPWYSKFFWKIIAGIKGIAVHEGAETSVYLASSDEVKGISGKYFDQCRLKEPSAATKDKLLQRQLWEISEKYCLADK